MSWRSSSGRPRVPAGTSTVLVSCTGGTYNVTWAWGCWPRSDRLLPALPRARTAVLLASAAATAAAATVTSALRRRDLAVNLLEVPDRQAAKNLATVARVAGELAGSRCTRTTWSSGVGGEVLCDIAGFVASTYNRGMPLALVPTTLAARPTRRWAVRPR